MPSAASLRPPCPSSPHLPCIMGSLTSQRCCTSLPVMRWFPGSPVFTLVLDKALAVLDWHAAALQCGASFLDKTAGLAALGTLSTCCSTMPHAVSSAAVPCLYIREKAPMSSLSACCSTPMLCAALQWRRMGSLSTWRWSGARAACMISCISSLQLPASWSTQTVEYPPPGACR